MEDKSYTVRVPKRWARIAMIVGVTALVVAPLTAVATHSFTDVPDGNTFHADIEWLADAGVTRGCNPPDNTEFCPDDPVTREQMSAFMRRLAKYMGAEDGTPAQADHAATANNASNLGGQPANSYARLQTSEWVFADDAADETFDGTNLTTKIIQAPEITQEVIDTGLVLVQMRFLNRTWNLPYISHAGGEPSTLDFYLMPGEVHITRFGHDNSPLAIGGVLQFRYIVIPNPAEILTVSGGQAADAADMAERSDE